MDVEGSQQGDSDFRISFATLARSPRSESSVMFAERLQGAVVPRFCRSTTCYRHDTMARIRIGVSGWRYPPWRGVFYPQGLAQHAELDYAATAFASIEINGSFYSLQRPESYASWYRHTPAGFVFALKGPRYITHMLKLRGCEQALANFLAPVSSSCVRSSAPFSGSCLPTSVTTRNAWMIFCRCCRETRRRRFPWPASVPAG